MILRPPTSYDEVPYGKLAFPQTHPDRLATIARIFGLSSPNVTECRVLELGCASGANLIPMAFNLPKSEFVGVDLSRRQVDDGRTTIRALDVRNITIEHASILDIDRSWGTFDYIICHGVFSWAEPTVQDTILKVSSDNLSASGISYVSYNTYPGWHMREMVRHMMRYHAERFDDPMEQVAEARALLDFLAASVSPDSGAYGRLLSSELEHVSKWTDSYLFHEHLEQTNSPLYFHQFVERAQRAGLQYLSEADLPDMLTHRLPTPVAETLERISRDILHVEQYMDFVKNRLFRQTLLCHETLRPKRALGPALMHGLMAASRARSESGTVDLTPGEPVIFHQGGTRVKAESPETKAALACLMEQWPQAIEVDQLCAIALDRADAFVSAASIDDRRRALMEDLFKCFVSGLIQLHAYRPTCVALASHTPRANALAAFQAETQDLVVNAWHETVRLDVGGREVLRLSNGQRTRGEILEALVQRAKSGALVLQTRGETATEVDVMRTALSSTLDETLTSLARSALLVD